MRPIHELNINEGGRPPSRRRPTPAEISSLATIVGHELPRAYIQLLEQANGGHPELSCLVPDGAAPTDAWEVNRIYHLGDLEPQAAEVRIVFARWREILGKNRLPFASDGGGNQFFIDFRTDPPCISIWIHDEQRALTNVASSFDALIDKLQRPDF